MTLLNQSNSGAADRSYSSNSTTSPTLHFDSGGPLPATWTVRATCNGPRGLVTRYLPFSAVVFVKWGNLPGQG